MDGHSIGARGKGRRANYEVQSTKYKVPEGRLFWSGSAVRKQVLNEPFRTQVNRKTVAFAVICTFYLPNAHFLSQKRVLSHQTLRPKQPPFRYFVLCNSYLLIRTSHLTPAIEPCAKLVIQHLFSNRGPRPKQTPVRYFVIRTLYFALTSLSPSHPYPTAIHAINPIPVFNASSSISKRG